jgi:hypothetical protein
MPLCVANPLPYIDQIDYLYRSISNLSHIIQVPNYFNTRASKATYATEKKLMQFQYTEIGGVGKISSETFTFTLTRPPVRAQTTSAPLSIYCAPKPSCLLPPYPTPRAPDRQ